MEVLKSVFDGIVNDYYGTNEQQINAAPRPATLSCVKSKNPRTFLVIDTLIARHGAPSNVQKSKLMSVKSSTVARLLKTLLGYAISGEQDKGDSVREAQYNRFVGKEEALLNKGTDTKAEKAKGLREILAYVKDSKNIPKKSRDRLLLKVITELEKNTPPQPGLVWDEAKKRWVNPENQGLPVHAVQGGKRFRGARLGSEKHQAGQSIQRLPKGTRKGIRSKFSQTLPKNLQRKSAQFRT